MAEWSIAADSKSAVRLMSHRGFKSLSLRQIKAICLKAVSLINR